MAISLESLFRSRKLSLRDRQMASIAQEEEPFTPVEETVEEDDVKLPPRETAVRETQKSPVPLHSKGFESGQITHGAGLIAINRADKRFPGYDEEDPVGLITGVLLEHGIPTPVNVVITETLLSVEQINDALPTMIYTRHDEKVAGTVVDAPDVAITVAEFRSKGIPHPLIPPVEPRLLQPGNEVRVSHAPAAD